MNRFKATKRTLAASAIGIAALAATIALAQPSAYDPATGNALPAPAAVSNFDWVQARLDRMAWRFNLTDEQKAKLKPVLEEREAQRVAQRQAMRKQLAEILTPAQLAQWDQMRGQRGWHRPGRRSCGGKGFGPGYGAGMGYSPGPTN